MAQIQVTVKNLNIEAIKYLYIFVKLTVAKHSTSLGHEPCGLVFSEKRNGKDTWQC